MQAFEAQIRLHSVTTAPTESARLLSAGTVVGAGVRVGLLSMAHYTHTHSVTHTHTLQQKLGTDISWDENTVSRGRFSVWL